MGSMSAKQERAAEKLQEQAAAALKKAGIDVQEAWNDEFGHRVAIIIRVPDQGSSFPRGSS